MPFKMSSTALAGSIRSPHSFSGGHVCRGATVAGLNLHTHSFILIGQRWVQEGGARGGIGARRQDPRRGARVTAASSPGHHGELVRAGGGGVVQVIWRGGRLEGPVLSLVGGVRRVGRRQVGVVPPRWSGCHGCCHGDAKGTVGDRVVRGGVGKGSCCGRVVDTWVGEAGVRQGGEGGERSF